MIWIKRLLLLFVGVLLGLTLLLAIVVAIFDEADYKRTLAWMADRFFDSDLIIDGALSVRLSDGLIINLGNVKLDAHDSSYHFSSHTLKADIQLRPLFSGTLWLNDLELRQLFLKVNETNAQSFELQDFASIPVIITRANFENLLIEYQEAPPGTLHRFSLDELRIDDIDDSGPIHVQANGSYGGEKVEIRGTLPSTTDLLDQVRPKPVELEVKSENGHAHIVGTIIDPVNGEGLDLQLALVTRNTTRLLEILGDGIPDVGELQITAILRGNYESPRLVDINAQLKRGTEVAIHASGQVNDIYTGAGLNIHFDGHSEQPDVASWLLFGKLGQLKSLEFNGTIQEKKGHFNLIDLQVTASTRKGLSVTAKGDAELYTAAHLFIKSDSGINATFSAPSTAAMNLLEVANVPELGAVSGSFKLLVSTDAIGLYDADVRIGGKGNSTARLQGQIRNIPLLDQSGATGIDMQLSAQSPDVAALTAKLGYTLPAIGAGEGSAHLSGDLDNLKMKQVHIHTGNKTELEITASGDIDRIAFGKTVKLDNALFDIVASTSNLRNLSSLTDINLPDRMPAILSSTMTLSKSKLVLNDLQVNIGRPTQPVIRLQGKVNTLLHKGSSIRINYNVAVADLVAAYTDIIPGYLGRLQGDADISDIDGSWGIEKFNLVSSQTSLYSVNLHGGFGDLKNSDLVNIKVDLEINDPAGLGNALGINLSGLKPYREDGLFTSKNDRIVYNGNMSIGQTSGTTTIHRRTHKDEPYFHGTVSIPVMDLTDLGFRLEQEIEEEIIAKPGSPGADYLFSREVLDVDFLNNFGLDIKINIDQIKNYGDTPIDSFVGHVSLQDGELKLDPLRFAYAGGRMDASFGLQAIQQPVYSLKMTADDLMLGPMLAQLDTPVTIKGRTNVLLDITASGGSAHKLASNLNGVINVEFEDTRIPTAYINLLTVDVFGWVMSNTVSRERYINLNCVLMHFTAKAGDIESKLLLADGPNMSVGGRVDLNLRDETINAVFMPRQKRRLFSTITPIKLSGPIRDPDVLAVPAQAAAQEIGALALSPTLYLSARLLETIWSKIRSGGDIDQGCTNIEKMTNEAEKAEKGKARQESDFNEPLSD